MQWTSWDLGKTTWSTIAVLSEAEAEAVAVAEAEVEAEPPDCVEELQVLQ